LNGGASGEKGYYATGQSWADAYNSGREQLRTHVLSNGEVIWDFSGNVWEWTDDTITNTHMVEPSASAGTSQWRGYFSDESGYGYLANAQGFNIIPNISTSYTGTSYGIGRIYIDEDNASDGGNIHAFLRGGYWYDGADAGVFTLNLNDAPTCTGAHGGFRCAR
jgi:formylglycine-generating enzyme required for sulfatase activity